MRLIKNAGFGLLGLGACMALAAATANAQQAAFTLPMEAHWGRVVLEPGDYKVSFPNPAEATPVLRVVGHGKTMNFLLQIKDDANKMPGENGVLRLVETDTGYRVASISDPATDRAFFFPLPKHHESASGSLHNQNAAKVAVQLKKASN